LNKALSDNGVHIRDGSHITNFIKQHLLNDSELEAHQEISNPH
jgi:hypothetical protein